MRRLMLAVPLALALAAPAYAASSLPPSSAEGPQCFPPPGLVVRDDTLYVTVRDGDCHWTTYAVPLPTHS